MLPDEAALWGAMLAVMAATGLFVWGMYKANTVLETIEDYIDRITAKLKSQ